MTEAARAFRGFPLPGRGHPLGRALVPAVPVSYRDLERMLADHGVQVDHTTMYRWVQRFAPELEKQTRRHLRACRGLWHVDEPTSGSAVHGATCTGRRRLGANIDSLLSATRDKKAARRFFPQAPARDDTRHPRVVITDRLKSYPGAIREPKRRRSWMKRHVMLW